MSVEIQEPPGAAEQRRARRARWSIPLLYFAGVLHWVLFFRRGQLSFEAYDWPKERLYLRALAQALRMHDFPLFLRVPDALRSFPQLCLVKDATGQPYVPLLAVPELNLSPQIVLLRWLEPGTFELVNVLLLYTIGFGGCLALRARHRLSALPFCALFLLFGFNGHIVSHLAVGHAMWSGYFLLPFFVHFALIWSAEPKTSSAQLGLAFTLAGLAFQGSLHLFVGAVLVIACAMACERELRPGGALALGLGFGLSAARLLPALLVLDLLPSSAFRGGYATLSDVLGSLLFIRGPDYASAAGTVGSLGVWEYDAYIGELGVLFLCYFGYQAMRQARRDRCDFARLALPLTLVALLSMSVVAYPLYALKFPLLMSERVTSRLLILPLLMLVAVSCIQLERWMGERDLRLRARAAIASLLVLEVLALASHSERWSLGVLENDDSLAWHELVTSAELIHPRPAWATIYEAALLVGALVSLASATWCWLVRRQGKAISAASRLASTA